MPSYLDPPPDDPGAAEAPITPADEWTIGRLLAWTTDYLKAKGSESPRLDAEVLLAHVLKCERVQLYTNYQTVVGGEHRQAYRHLVRRRATGAPVAYLVGRKEFYSLPLDVSPAVLIPRPDTETLVAEFLTLFKDHPAPRALDIGTGSGAVALACLSQHKSARFIATDRSREALTVARGNAAKLSLAARVEFRQGDLYEPVAADAPFDAILSNPPYIPTGEVSNLEPGVRDFEPHMALDGGPDGLDVVRRMIAGAPEHLIPGGHLLLEIGTTQEEPVRTMIAQQPALDLAPTIRDAAHHPRVVRALRK
jgi:release factor glutamine methyltransferase